MGAELNENQLETARQKSRTFERGWRSVFHPDKFTSEEIKSLEEFFNSQEENFRLATELVEYTVDKNILIKIYMGLFHYPRVEIPKDDGEPFSNN